MIDFLKFKWLYFLISGTIIAFGLYSIITFGFKYSIDFSGGSLMEYKVDKQLNISDIKKTIKIDNLNISSMDKVGDDYIIKTVVIEEAKEKILRSEIENKYKVKLTLLRFETVGPTLGKETMNKTITASLIAILGILVYLTFTFQNFKFAIAAILAMLHDFLVVVGCYSLLSKYFGAEVDTLFITSILTTMSFSVHDTIVVFDKIREYKKIENTDFTILANKALTETMVRSLNNSLTIVLMLLALVLLGGESIKFFALTLLIGTVIGTYSSPFIATPILEFLEKRK
jgi:preprotein translocase subunit SecF